MRVGIFAAAAAFLALTLTGCAATQSTEQVVLRYNRAFAQSRNEILLLNILRAAAREPLQFSAMGTVSGSIGNGGEISIPFTTSSWAARIRSPRHCGSRMPSTPTSASFRWRIRIS